MDVVFLLSQWRLQKLRILFDRGSTRCPDICLEAVQRWIRVDRRVYRVKKDFVIARFCNKHIFHLWVWFNFLQVISFLKRSHKQTGRPEIWMRWSSNIKQLHNRYWGQFEGRVFFYLEAGEVWESLSMLHVFYAFEMFSNNQNLWYLWYGLSTSGPKAAGNYLHANSKSCRAGMCACHSETRCLSG